MRSSTDQVKIVFRTLWIALLFLGMGCSSGGEGGPLSVGTSLTVTPSELTWDGAQRVEFEVSTDAEAWSSQPSEGVTISPASGLCGTTRVVVLEAPTDRESKILFYSQPGKLLTTSLTIHPAQSRPPADDEEEPSPTMEILFYENFDSATHSEPMPADEDYSWREPQGVGAGDVSYSCYGFYLSGEGDDAGSKGHYPDASGDRYLYLPSEAASDLSAYFQVSGIDVRGEESLRISMGASASIRSAVVALLSEGKTLTTNLLYLFPEEVVSWGRWEANVILTSPIKELTIRIIPFALGSASERFVLDDLMVCRGDGTGTDIGF